MGTVLLVKVGGGEGLRELSMVDGFMADGLVEAENRKGSGMTTEFWRQGALGHEHYQCPQTRYFRGY